MGDQDQGHACAAHDVKAMMSDLIGHVTDTDRKNGVVLRQMQERLDALGADAHSARKQVPHEFQPGFDRIQDGLSLLAERIAQSYFLRSESVAEPTSAHDRIGEITQALNERLAHPAPVALPVVPVGARSSLEQPDALRSSTPAQLRARGKAYAAHVDPFDVIESLPGNPVEPWEADQVEALSQAYSSEVSPPHSQPQAFEINAMPVKGSLTDDDIHRIDTRLAKVAERLEASIAKANPDGALLQLTRQLAEIERGLGHALDGLATKTDVATLTQLEMQITDLRRQFDKTHAQLVRIDDLEQQLASVSQQTSRDTLQALLASSQPAPAPSTARTDVDFHTIAIAAAEAAASRVATATANTADRQPDIHGLLSTFIAERRQEDEQTASTLDTLQQAMLRLLDRMEGGDVPQGHSDDHDDEQGHARRQTASYADMPDAVFHQQVHAPFEALISPIQTHERAPVAHHSAPTNEIEPTSEPLDYLAQQRAKMQASVQRAAAAQREKTQNPSKSDPRKGKAPAVSRRLMVSGLALIVSVGALSAGAVVMSWPRTDAALVAAPTLDAAGIKRPDQAGDTPQATPSKMSASGRAAAQSRLIEAQREARLNGGAETPSVSRSAPMPETVTDDLDQGQGQNVPEVDRVPDGNPMRSDLARGQMALPSPMTGILVQKSASSDSNLATNVSVSSEEAIGSMGAHGRTAASASVATGQSGNTSLELPPATVGPLSLRVAAAQGDLSAQFEVASRLAEGKGTDQNLKEAVRWYQRSATQGFAQAQYRLGTLYERGLGVKADAARARSWYQRAAEQGNVKAMHNLAVLAAGHSSQSPDYASAAKWFSQAAGYGLADSQFNLAVLTESGLGVEKDMVQAAMWFTLAARAGDKEATRRRDLMKSKMDKSDLAAADHLVRTWQPMVPAKLANDPHAAGEAWKSRQAVSSEN